MLHAGQDQAPADMVSRQLRFSLLRCNLHPLRTGRECLASVRVVPSRTARRAWLSSRAGNALTGRASDLRFDGWFVCRAGFPNPIYRSSSSVRVRVVKRSCSMKSGHRSVTISRYYCGVRSHCLSFWLSRCAYAGYARYTADTCSGNPV